MTGKWTLPSALIAISAFGASNVGGAECTALETGEVIAEFSGFPFQVLRGLTFREDTLWGIVGSRLMEMDADTGEFLSQVRINERPNAGELGYDSSRDLFVVANSFRRILTIDALSGRVVDEHRWRVSPSGPPYGAAYDSRRDGYWITGFGSRDFPVADRLTLIDPETAAGIRSLAAPEGASRLAGAAYERHNDVLAFNSRDSGETYVISADDGEVRAVFPTPPSLGRNNGNGIAIRPSNLKGYLLNYESRSAFVVELGLSKPIDIAIVRRHPPACIDLLSRRPIEVAILGSPELDVRDVDVATLGLGPNCAGPLGRRRPRLVHVDGDGFTDVLLRFSLRGSGLTVEDSEVCLTGTTFAGTPIKGCTHVRLVHDNRSCSGRLPFADGGRREVRSELASREPPDAAAGPPGPPAHRSAAAGTVE